MSNIQVNRVTNANVYVDGTSFLGKFEEFTLPTIKAIMSEHKALGMNGKFELPAGIDKLEARGKWNSFYPAALLKFADPNTSIQLQVRSSLKTWGSAGVLAEVPVVVHLTAQVKDFPLGAYKQHDNVELETLLNCSYVKLVIDGKDIVEIDVLSNVHKVNGADILAKYRQNLGI